MGRFAWCTGVALAVLIAGGGCVKPGAIGPGWVQLDVPAAAIPSGWMAYNDPAGGLSMDLPNDWVRVDAANGGRLATLTSFFQRYNPSSRLAPNYLLAFGGFTDLAFIDSNPEALKESTFTYVMMRHLRVDEETVTLNEAVRYFSDRFPSNPVERLRLPIGSCMRQIRDQTGLLRNGRTAQVRCVTYIFMYRHDMYVVAASAPVELFPKLEPIMEQIMDTVRLTKPQPPATPVASRPAAGRFGGWGAVSAPAVSPFQVQNPPPVTPEPPATNDQSAPPTGADANDGPTNYPSQPNDGQGGGGYPPSGADQSGAQSNPADNTPPPNVPSGGGDQSPGNGQQPGTGQTNDSGNPSLPSGG